MQLPILHGDPSSSFLLSWNPEPVPTALLIISALVYLIALWRARQAGRPQTPDWQVLCYFAGLLSLTVALVGPIGAFDDEAFFIHMTQHLIFLQIAAPLILLGRPVQTILHGLSPRQAGKVTRAILRPRVPRTILEIITHPIVAFFLFNGALIIWHFPSFYDRAQGESMTHDFEHLTFLVSALLYWWTLIDPVPRHHKLPTLWALASLFFSMIVSSALGAVLTLSSTIIYPYYNTIHHAWGLSPMTDQQLGGLIMWVVGGLIYTFILIGIVAKALNLDPDDDGLVDASTPAIEWLTSDS